jgi:hypothetical protein
MVRLAVAPRPGTALEDGRAVLGWLERGGGSNVGLVLDKEDPALAREAGGRLFHVRLQGRAPTQALIEALAQVDYRGVLSAAAWEGASTADQSPQTSSSTSSAT